MFIDSYFLFQKSPAANDKKFHLMVKGKQFKSYLLLNKSEDSDVLSHSGKLELLIGVEHRFQQLFSHITAASSPTHEYISWLSHTSTNYFIQHSFQATGTHLLFEENSRDFNRSFGMAIG